MNQSRKARAWHSVETYQQGRRKSGRVSGKHVQALASIQKKENEIKPVYPSHKKVTSEVTIPRVGFLGSMST